MSHDREYLAFRATTKKLLLIIGLWPTATSKLLNSILSWIQIFISVGMVFGIAGYVYKHFNNVALVTKGMSVMASFISVTLKVSCIMINRKDLADLHEMLDLYFWTLLNDLQCSRVALKRITTFRYLSSLLTGFLMLASVTYVIIPFVFIIQQHRHQVHPIKYLLIFPTNYPWTIPPNGLLYKLHYIYETAANVTLTCITAGVDSLFILYVFQMIAQFREMSYRISHTSEKEDFGTTLRRCVLQHNILIKSRDILEKIYGPIIIWVMVTNAVVLCSIIFQFTQMTSISPVRITFLVAYIMLKLTQTFMYAWTGSLLTHESENYREAVYSSNWYSQEHHSAAIIIILAQKPLTLTACQLSVVSIDIFLTVLNTTASYFFLLQTIHEKD